MPIPDYSFERYGARDSKPPGSAGHEEVAPAAPDPDPQVRDARSGADLPPEDVLEIRLRHGHEAQEHVDGVFRYAEGSSRVRARRGAVERDRDTEMRRVQRERAAAQHEGQREDRPPRDERTDHRAPGNGRGAPGNGAPQR